jgi:hypothetical protein
VAYILGFVQEIRPRGGDALRNTDARSVIAGGDVGAEPLFVAGATPGAAATKQKENSWSPDEQNAVMEAYAMVSGDPTAGASQSATEFAEAVPGNPAAPDER